MSIWKRRLIVAAAPLAQDLIQAFLTAGATAVICYCDGKAEAADCPDAGCFTALYESLLGKAATLSTAVEAASESPSLSTKHQEKKDKTILEYSNIPGFRHRGGNITLFNALLDMCDPFAVNLQTVAVLTNLEAAQHAPADPVATQHAVAGLSCSNSKAYA